MSLRQLWAQIAQTTGARVYSLLAGLVVLGVTARYLGPTGRGVVAAAVGWATLLATAAGLSLGQVAIYHAAGRDPREWLGPTLGVMLPYVAIASAVCAVAVAAVYAATDGAAFRHIPWTALMLAVLAVPGLMWTEYATSLLMSLDALRIANIGQAVGATLNAALVVVLLTFTGLGVNAPLLATAAAGIGVGAFTATVLLRRSGSWVSGRSRARPLFSGALRLHANAIGTFLYAQATVLIVNQYRPAADTAFFGLAVQLMMVAQIVPMSIGMVAYTLVGKLGPDGAWDQQRRLLIQGLGLTALIVVAGYLLAPFAVRVIAGAEFLPAADIFRLMLPSLFGMTMSSVLASQWIGRGMFVRAAFVTLAAGALNVLLAYALVPRYGTTGGAWAMLGVYTVTAIINGIMATWVHSHAGQGNAKRA